MEQGAGEVTGLDRVLDVTVQWATGPRTPRWDDLWRRIFAVLDKQEPPAGMSILQASVEAMVSTATLYALANRGKLPGARRIGKRIIIHRETFLRWLADGMGE